MSIIESANETKERLEKVLEFDEFGNFAVDQADNITEAEWNHIVNDSSFSHQLQNWAAPNHKAHIVKGFVHKVGLQKRNL